MDTFRWYFRKCWSFNPWIMALSLTGILTGFRPGLSHTYGLVTGEGAVLRSEWNLPGCGRVRCEVSDRKIIWFAALFTHTHMCAHRHRHMHTDMHASTWTNRHIDACRDTGSHKLFLTPLPLPLTTHLRTSTYLTATGSHYSLYRWQQQTPHTHTNTHTLLSDT